jgi:lysyl-tRNA synthetase class 2
MSVNQTFYIDEKVQEVFPEIKVGYVIIRDVRIALEHPELETLKQSIAEEVRKQLQGQSIPQLPRIKAFRAIYKKFGVDPASKRPSAEALIRRVADPNKGLYSVNTVVDAYNITSIQYQLPMAAYDLDQITLPVVLRFAQASEMYRAIGQTQPEGLLAGELVYADQINILCRDFNYRDSDVTKVTLESQNLLVFVDGCDEVDRTEMLCALENVAKRLVSFNGGQVIEHQIFPNGK